MSRRNPKFRDRSACATGFLALLAATAGAPAGFAADAARGQAGAALPDWRGVFETEGGLKGLIFDPATVEPPGGIAGEVGVRQRPPYNAEWEAKYEANLKKSDAGILPDPLTVCLPRGTPGNMRSVDQYEFVVTPKQTWIFIENGSQVRRIYTDGRPHRSGKDLIPTYTGDSIGHWEGDTLVVDTIGLRGDMILDRSGATLSDKVHMVERIRRVDKGIMEDLITINDPVSLTKPWVVRRRWTITPPGSRIYDYACAESTRNPIDAQGRTMVLDAEGNRLQ